MKITKLTIFGYGKWSQKTLDFTNNPIVLLGDNEAGKSTIQSFIRHILFGFPKQRKDAEYVPKTSNDYGGRLYLSDEQYGEIIVERVRRERGSSTGELTITTLDGERLPDSILHTITGNLSLNLYDRFFSLQLDDLHQLKTVQREELNKYFLTIGTTGSDALFQLHDKWLKESSDFYKLNGKNPILNQKIDALSELSEKLTVLENRQVQYADLVSNELSWQEKKQEIDHKEKQYKEQLQQLEWDNRLFEQLVAYDTLNNSYREDIAQLPIQLKDQYASLCIREKEFKQQLVLANERQQQDDTNYSSDFLWFKQHQTDIKQTVQRLPQIERLLQQILMLDVELHAKEDSLISEKQRLGLQQNDNLPLLTAEQIEQAEELVTSLNDMQKQHEQYAYNYTTHQQKMTEQADKVAQYKQHIEQTENSPSNAYKIWGIASSVVFIMSLIIGSLSRNLVFASLGVGLAIILVGITLKLYQQNQKEQKKRALRLEQQKRYYERERELYQLHQQSVVQLDSQLKATQQGIEEINQQISNWKTANNLLEQFNLEQLVNGVLQQAQIWENEYDQLYAERQLFEKNAQQYNQQFAFFNAEYAIISEQSTEIDKLRQQSIAFKQYVDRMMLEEVSFNQQQIRVDQLSRDKQYISSMLERIQVEKQSLWQNYGQESEEQFRQLLQIQAEQQDIAQKLELLKTQIGESEQRLRQYASQEHIQQLQQQAVDNLHTIQEEQLLCNEQLANVRQEKRALEEDGVYLDVKQQYAILEDEVLELIKQTGERLLGAQLIEELLRTGKQSHLDQVIRDASLYFKRLTFNRYQEVVFEKDQLHVQRDDYMRFELNELSRGTLEQLYVALRLAFIKHIQEQLNMPIIIDDCFVNFDEKRRLAMYHILQELSQTHQIFYFTFSTEILEQLVEKQVITL